MFKALEQFEIKLENNGIILRNIHIPIKNVNGMCFSYDNNYNFSDVIVYDSIKLDNDPKKIYEVLLHEEAHLEHPETMYSLDDPYYRIKQKERKALRFISRKHIPQELLFNLIYIKKMELYEISEHLCLPEQLIQDAYNYYSNLESWINKKNNLPIDEI